MIQRKGDQHMQRKLPDSVIKVNFIFILDSLKKFLNVSLLLTVLQIYPLSWSVDPLHPSSAPTPTSRAFSTEKLEEECSEYPIYAFHLEWLIVNIFPPVFSPFTFTVSTHKHVHT